MHTESDDVLLKILLAGIEGFTSLFAIVVMGSVPILSAGIVITLFAALWK